jgi:hypothetical protein
LLFFKEIGELGHTEGFCEACAVEGVNHLKGLTEFLVFGFLILIGESRVIFVESGFEAFIALSVALVVVLGGNQGSSQDGKEN